MSKFLWLLDMGHGGLRDGKQYTTAPAKMHIFPDGLTIYEGVINRAVGYKLAEELKDLEIDHMVISDDEEDIPLSRRVEEINDFYEIDRSAILISIHSNAGGGSGFEIFTSRGQTRSDKIAEVFAKVYKSHFPEFKFRSDLIDGDSDKEADFYILAKTNCPAVLVENLFFDNRKEAEFLLSSDGQNRLCECLLQCIIAVEGANA